MSVDKKLRRLQNKVLDAQRMEAFVQGDMASYYAAQASQEAVEEFTEYATAQFKNRTRSQKGSNVATTTIARRPQPSAKPNAPVGPAAPFQIVQGIRTAQKYLKLFFYGDYGSGKTVLSASSVDVPSMCDVLYIDIESGNTSIRGSRAVENHANIDFVPCKDFDTFVAIHRMLLAHCTARDANDAPRLAAMASKYGFDPSRRYRTVVIDSLSELNQISLARAFGDNQDDLLSTSDSDDTRRDFGRNKQAILKTVRAFRNLPLNVIATCGREWDQDERKKLGYQPRLTGALSKEVQAFWDVVGFLQTAAKAPKAGDTEDAEATSTSPVARRLWLQPVGKFDAKNRLSSQEVTFIDDPTMAKLVSLLTKGKPSK